MTKTIIAALALALGTTAAYAADPADKSAGEHPPTKAVGEKAGQTPGTPESAQQAGGGQHPPQKAMDKAAGGQTEQDKAVKESQSAQDKAAGGRTEQDKAVKESQSAQDKAAAGGQSDKPQTGAAGREGQQAAAGQGQGRNWDNIDKDNNNLVSAEEMESWLKANPGPLAGSAGAAGKEGTASKEEGKDASKEPAAADKEKKQ